MAGRKRARSPHPEASRKSSRKASAPVKLGFEPVDYSLPPVDLPYIPAAHPENSYRWQNVMEIMDTRLEEYDNMLNFLPAKRSGYLENDHRRIQKCRDKMRTLFYKYWVEMENMLALTGNAMDEVIRQIGEGPFWYENIASSLFSLDYDRLKDFMDRLPIQDPKHFQRHLVRVFTEHVRHNSKKKRFYAEGTVKTKALLLEETLRRYSEHCSPELSFHLCMSWSTVLFNHKDKSDLGSTLLGRAHGYLGTRERTRIRNIPLMYWDTASARRQVLEMYQAEVCKEPSWAYFVYQAQQCYHRKNRELLRVMGRDAWREVSWRVQLAVGHVLPAELADLVLDFSLQAEGLTAETHFAHRDRRKKQKVPTPLALQCGLMRACRDAKTHKHYDSERGWDILDTSESESDNSED